MKTPDSSAPFVRLASTLVLLLTAGCGNFALPHQAWVEARIQGTVVDAATDRPIEGVDVSRVRPPTPGDTYSMEKGGQKMQKRPAVATTDADGKFVLVGEQTANLFLESFPDFAVTVKIQHSGYETLQRHYTNVVLGTPRNPREPVIDIGTVKLKPSL